MGQALLPEDESEAFTEQKASHKTSLPPRRPGEGASS